MPKRSIVSVSTHGCIRSNEQKRMFKAGLKEMIKILEPTDVLVHGHMPECVFAEFQNDLKYSLLTAHTKSKKAREFSVKLADCIKILSMIRNKPGIKTQELVEQLEKSNRTVQRYIETLRMASEWIVYDSKKKGWYLEYGTSQLFEVYFERGE